MVRARALAIVGLLLAGCASPTQTPIPTLEAARTPGVAATPTLAPATPAPASVELPSPSADARTAGWRADIDQLIAGLESRHPNIESQLSLTDLEQAARGLSERVPTSTDDELLVGIMGIVAMVSA